MYIFYMVGLILLMFIMFLTYEIINMAKNNPDRLFKLMEQSDDSVNPQQALITFVFILTVIGWLMMIGLQ